MRNVFEWLKLKIIRRNIDKEKEWYAKGLLHEHLARFREIDVINNYKKAIACYKKAPHISTAFIGMAKCFEGLGDHNKAREIRNWVASNTEKLSSAYESNKHNKEA